MAAAVGAHPRRAGELTALLCRLAVTVLASVAPRVALQRLAVMLDEFSFERLPLAAEWRWSCYLRAQARVVRLVQLKWIRQWKFRPVIPLASDRVPVQRLVPDTLIGVHALEEHGGRLFRWTEPVALLRLPPREQEHEIRIETAGIRGDPLAVVIAVLPQRARAAARIADQRCGRQPHHTSRRRSRPPPEATSRLSALRWPRRVRDPLTQGSWACLLFRSRVSRCAPADVARWLRLDRVVLTCALRKVVIVNTADEGGGAERMSMGILRSPGNVEVGAVAAASLTRNRAALSAPASHLPKKLRMLFFSPSRSGTFAVHPSDDSRETSTSLRGAPSGFDGSKVILPR